MTTEVQWIGHWIQRGTPLSEGILLSHLKGQTNAAAVYSMYLAEDRSIWTPTSLSHLSGKSLYSLHLAGCNVTSVGGGWSFSPVYYSAAAPPSRSWGAWGCRPSHPPHTYSGRPYGHGHQIVLLRGGKSKISQETLSSFLKEVSFLLF